MWKWRKGHLGCLTPYKLEQCTKCIPFFFIHQISGMQLKQIEKWLYLVLGKLEKHVIGEKRSRWELYFRWQKQIEKWKTEWTCCEGYDHENQSVITGRRSGLCFCYDEQPNLRKLNLPHFFFNWAPCSYFRLCFKILLHIHLRITLV